MERGEFGPKNRAGVSDRIKKEEDNRRIRREAMYENVKWRMVRGNKADLDNIRRDRYSTGYSTVDNMLGGLPKGLIVFSGGEGTGKSLIARNIASKADRALYFVCEVLTDAPSHLKFSNVDVIDYTIQQPIWSKALEEMFTFIEVLKPTLVVIDSLTSYFSVTKKALPESDIREAVSKVHLQAEGIVPIIGISEVRGIGFSRSDAGGMGVQHGCSMRVVFKHEFIDYENQVKKYGLRMGDDIYTMRCAKDKAGMADRREYVVNYVNKQPVVKILELR